MGNIYSKNLTNGRNYTWNTLAGRDCLNVLASPNHRPRKEITNQAILGVMTIAITVLKIFFWAVLFGSIIGLVIWSFFLWIFSNDEQAQEQQDDNLVDTTAYDEEEYRL